MLTTKVSVHPVPDLKPAMIATTKELGSSSNEQNLAKMQAALDTLLQEAIDSERFLGISYVAVNREGKVLYSGAHGSQTFAKDKPLEMSTAGWLASMTKVMGSVAAMQCVEKGLIGLDDDLSLVVPEFKDIQILTAFAKESKMATYTKPTEKITLRRLLSHSSGFAYDPWNPTLLAWSEANGKDKEIGTGKWEAWVRPLVFNPGTSWLYSQGIDWAGRVVELVSSQSLEDFMQENIWSRVGMHNTTFHPERRESFPILQLGMRLHGPTKPLTASDPPWPCPVKDDMGGCGLYSTAEDYGKMLAALLSDDGPILKKENIEIFISPQLSQGAKDSLAVARAMDLVQVDIPRDIPVDHGLGGLVVLEDIPQRRKKGSMNWDGMSNPQWMIDRKSGIACALLTQILPCPDAALKALWTELEKVVYKYVDTLAEK